MKNVVLAFVGLLCSVCSLAQELGCQDKLELVYGLEKAQAIVDSGVEAIDFHCFKNSHGYYLSEMPASKSIAEFPNVLDFTSDFEGFGPELSPDNLDNVFLGAYGIQPLHDTYQYFRVGESNILFVVYPNTRIEKLYSQQ